MHLTPGDAASVMLGRDATEEQKIALRERLGLNEPIPVQFINWFWAALRLDFGDSLFMGKPVIEALRDRAEPTGLLAFRSEERRVGKEWSSRWAGGASGREWERR